VAVASAGPYASLHLAPDRQPRQHPSDPTTQAGCPSCHPTNSVKALKVPNNTDTIRSYIERFADFTDVFRRETVIIPVEPTVPEILGSTQNTRSKQLKMS